MGWDKNKCRWGVPDNFDDEKALEALTNADFSKSVYVNTSEQEGKTRQAFTYYVVGDYRICVVGHIHPLEGGATAGNSYIPGWQNWAHKTPEKVVKIIAGLSDGGEFPGDNRYPHKV